MSHITVKRVGRKTVFFLRLIAKHFSHYRAPFANVLLHGGSVVCTPDDDDDDMHPRATCNHVVVVYPRDGENRH